MNIGEGNHPWELKQFAGGITSALKQIAENKKEDGKGCWKSRSEESEHGWNIKIVLQKYV